MKKFLSFSEFVNENRGVASDEEFLRMIANINTRALEKKEKNKKRSADLKKIDSLYRELGKLETERHHAAQQAFQARRDMENEAGQLMQQGMTSQEMEEKGYVDRWGDEIGDYEERASRLKVQIQHIKNQIMELS